MKNIKLTIEYDGTNYAGWQRQKNAISIQQVLENAITKLTGEKVEVSGSSRTDSGVHARGFVGNFHTSSSIPGERFKMAINGKLPDDIVIVKSEEVSEDFHARYNSKGKKYSYTILNRRCEPAIGRNYVYHYRGKLNVEAMKEAAVHFIGTHDFEAFKSLGSSVKTTVRTITSLNVYKNDDIVKIEISGDGFLYNMVRIISGTLLFVGIGKIKPEEIPDILLSKNRKRAGKVLPARGLCLEEVYY